MNVPQLGIVSRETVKQVGAILADFMDAGAPKEVAFNYLREGSVLAAGALLDETGQTTEDLIRRAFPEGASVFSVDELVTLVLDR